MPETDAEQELQYPCGQWFAPPVNKYRVWIEAPGRISPRQNLLVYAGTPFRQAGLPALAPLVPAGGVGVPDTRPAAEGESIRLFATTSRWSPNAFLFDRRLHTSVVQMPAGDSVILGRFDRRTNDAIALSRPIAVEARRTQRIWPTAPSASDVLVILRKPPTLQLRKPAPLARLTLNGRDADVLVNATDRIVAVWYGVDAPRAEVALVSDSAHWEPRTLRLVPGKVTTIRSEVRPLPSAKVSVNAPVDAKLPEEVTLEVHRGSEAVRKVAANVGVHELHELPAAALRVVLRIGQWEWDEVLDLTNGEDGQLAFDLEPLSVHGTVFHGGEPAAAEITFRNGDDRWVAVKTDAEGRYETTLWWSDVQTVRVAIPDQTPFLDPFREIFESGRYDFRVPRTDYRVRIVDAQTGKGIAGARVSAGNITAEGLTVAQHVVTNEHGHARLPPLRDGELTVSVSAERYAPAEPRKMTVDHERHDVEIALQPLRMTATVRVVLAGGAPAADAEVWALDRTMNPLWRGRASSEGLLELPDPPHDVLLLLRHPGAASSVRTAKDGEWRLDPPAQPLTLNVDPSAQVAVWLDGVRLAGPALSFAAWSGPSANPYGVWIGRNLPQKPLQVIAGQLDALVERIDYPWP
ncbi:MAG TPA: carboxypeptidase-like regulatory domain-containing protein [Thermoanaerobaculia bacterium]|nr:carboxypeptidase-like regulatory domain-containing protein [Thermoanaerobaculia bacterium]